MSCEPGTVVEGRVAKLVKHGAIVELGEGKSGLVHISQIADAYVHDVADYFAEGDVVRVKILGVDDRGRFELSAKQVETREPIRPVPQAPRREARRGGDMGFEQMLTDFMKQSEQRLVELKRNRDAKRKRRRRR